jgi:hypothetical protein
LRDWTFGRGVLKGGGFAGPLVLLAVPKCPFCLLPLVLAIGLGPPSRYALDTFAVGVGLLWAAAILVRSPSTTVVAGAITATAASLAGRWLDAPWLLWLGAATMFVIWLWSLRGARGCRGGCSHPGRLVRLD